MLWGSVLSSDIGGDGGWGCRGGVSRTPCGFRFGVRLIRTLSTFLLLGFLSSPPGLFFYDITVGLWFSVLLNGRAAAKKAACGFTALLRTVPFRL